jgi:glycosyltransferase involved in cell wall biosynthesis
VLLNSSELRLTLGRNARETVTSRFSAASMANQYLKIYREAAFSKGRLVQQAGL